MEEQLVNQPQLSIQDHLLLEMGKDAPGSAIKALLTLKNISQTEFAKRCGFSPSEISRVIRGKRHTRKIQRAIAVQLGYPVEKLFSNNR